MPERLTTVKSLQLHKDSEPAEDPFGFVLPPRKGKRSDGMKGKRLMGRESGRLRHETTFIVLVKYELLKPIIKKVNRPFLMILSLQLLPQTWVTPSFPFFDLQILAQSANRDMPSLTWFCHPTNPDRRTNMEVARLHD